MKVNTLVLSHLILPKLQVMHNIHTLIHLVSGMQQNESGIIATLVVPGISILYNLYIYFIKNPIGRKKTHTQQQQQLQSIT